MKKYSVTKNEDGSYRLKKRPIQAATSVKSPTEAVEAALQERIKKGAKDGC